MNNLTPEDEQGRRAGYFGRRMVMKILTEIESQGKVTPKKEVKQGKGLMKNVTKKKHKKKKCHEVYIVNLTNEFILLGKCQEKAGNKSDDNT